MSRSKHKSFSRHENEKYKKKSRVHRIKYEKGRNERDIAEKNVKKKLWSIWLNFIRGHWCGRIKNKTNSLDICTRALSADVFDISIERKSTATGTKMAIPKHCRVDPALLNNNPYCMSEKTENFHKNEDRRLMQYSDNYHKARMGKNSTIPKLYFDENKKQAVRNAKCATPRSDGHGEKLRSKNGSNRRIIQNTVNQSKRHIPKHSCIQNFNMISSEPIWSEKAEIYQRRQIKTGIDNLLDHLISTNWKKSTEKQRIKYNMEGSMVGQKESLSPKISRQVPPAILVNIKPFKNRVSQSDFEANLETSKLDLNQTKKTEELEEKVCSQWKGIEKQSKNSQLRCSALKNQVLTLRNSWDTGKEKALLPKKIPTENQVVKGSLSKDFCFLVGIHRSYNKVYGEINEKYSDGRDHNLVFKKNMRHFRKKINKETIKGEEKEAEVNELKSENELEANVRREKLEVEKILTVLMTCGVMLGIYYNIVIESNAVKTIFVREEIHTIIKSQIVREFDQLHASYFKTVIQKKFSNVAKQFLIREMRDIPVDKLKTARILHELKYCLRNVKGVARVMFSPKRAASDIFFITREYSTTTEPEQVESQDNITDLLSFLQEYSELVEKSCSDDDLIDIEKILAKVAKTFIETDSESEGSSINTNILVEDLAKDHRVVQILNSSALEYLALIYHSLRPRSCSGKSFSDADLYKRRRQAIALSTELSVMKDFDSRVFRQRVFTPNSNVDLSQILYYDMESVSDEGDEAVENHGSGTENILKSKTKDSILPIDRKKMLMFKSNSFPGEIALMRDNRSQKSRLFKDFHKDFEKRRKSIEEGLDSKGGHLGSEKPIKTESESAKIPKYLISEQLKKTNENGSKKIFFMEKNAGELKKEVIAAFSTIKDLTEEKDNAKTSVVIMLSRK